MKEKYEFTLTHQGGMTRVKMDSHDHGRVHTLGPWRIEWLEGIEGGAYSIRNEKGGFDYAPRLAFGEAVEVVVDSILFNLQQGEAPW